MRIDINDKAKFVAVWLGNGENIKSNFPKNIEKELDRYKEKKYKICIYESGKEDIKQNLLNLVINNAN